MLVNWQGSTRKKSMKIDLKNAHLNIDTVKFSVEGVHMQVPDATVQTTTNEDGEILYTATNRKPLVGIDGRHTLYYRYQPTKQRLTVEGSLAGYLFGQNVFTTPKLQRLCLEVLDSIREELKLEVDAETWARWEAGEITLERVDIAVNMRLDSSAQVDKILLQAAQQLVTRSSMQKAGSTLYWAPKKGKAYKIGFYDKGAEMNRSARARKAKKVTEQAKPASAEARRNAAYGRLQELCQQVLRVELHLNKAALRVSSLETVSAWSAASARTVTARYLRNVPLMNAVVGEADTFDYAALAPKYRRVLAVYLSGAPIDTVYSESAQAQHAAMFRELGIDLKARVTAKEVVPLATFFNGRAMAPAKWMRSEGLRADWCSNQTPPSASRERGITPARQEPEAPAVAEEVKPVVASPRKPKKKVSTTKPATVNNARDYLI